MMIIMRADARPQEIETVVQCVQRRGAQAHVSSGAERTVIGIVGDTRRLSQDEFIRMEGVDRIVPISKPYKLASREFHPQDTVFRVGDAVFGGAGLTLIAGPCSVESRSQLLEIAHAVREAGAHALRGGAFKPRTSPYSFQGLGEAGLELLAEARAATGLPIVTEVMSPEQLPLVARYADVLQIGARNMQNYALLQAAGRSGKPVLLKRGPSATLDEWLLAAEYLLAEGNLQVALCERGIRTFATATRNTTDINAVPALKDRTHLPVFLDPSHSTGRWEYVAAIARAGVAAGADGLIVEVHHRPQEALSDGGQSLKPERFAALVSEARQIAAVIGRPLAQPETAHVRPA